MDLETVQASPEKNKVNRWEISVSPCIYIDGIALLALRFNGSFEALA